MMARFHDLSTRTALCLLSTLGCLASTGTALRAQARLLKDINPTPIPQRSSPTAQRVTTLGEKAPFLVIGTKLIYSGQGRYLVEPYALDLKTLKSSLLYDSYARSSNPYFLGAVSGKLIFEASPLRYTYDVFLSDTTRAGTQAIGMGLRPTEVAAVGGAGFRFVMAAKSTASGSELWISDGTAQRTKLLKDIRPGSLGSAPTHLFPSGGLVFFVADDGTHGKELWVTDGTTAGTRILADLEVGAKGSSPAHFKELKPGLVAFDATTSKLGRELYTASKSSARLVKDIAPGPSNGADLGNATVLGGKLLFRGTTGQHGTEPWISDGSNQGTKLLADIQQGPASGDFLRPVRSGSVVYFEADSNLYGRELHLTDGTTKGTRIVADLYPGPIGYGYSQITSFGNGKVLFVPPQDNAPYVSDGSVKGTHKLLNIYSKGSSRMRHLTDSGQGFAVFSAYDGVGDELWISDGTLKGTKRLEGPDYPLGHTQTSWAAGLFALGSKMFLSADDGVHGKELWVTDGSSQGTKLFVDIYPGKNASYPRELTAFKNGFAFIANDGIHGPELWFSDGTASGTRMVRDTVKGGGASGVAGYLRVLQDKLWFEVQDGVELSIWTSNGTKDGTRKFLDLKSVKHRLITGLESADVSDRIVFLALFNQQTSTIFSSDGTVSGTYPLLRKGLNWKDDIRQLHGPFPGGVLFSSTTALDYRILGVTDGTRSGTKLFADLTGIRTGYSLQLATLGSSVFFSGWKNSLDGEPYVSDGTAAGTHMLKDIQKAGSSDPNMFTTIGTRHVFFTAVETRSGRELYITDGSANGTKLHLDLNKGRYGSRYGSIAALGNTLFICADDGALGTELWVQKLGAVANEIGHSCGSSRLHADDPVLGTKVTIRGEHRLLPNTPHVLLMGAIADAPLLRVGPCYSSIDLTKPFIPLAVQIGTSWKLSVTLPNVPALASTRVCLQTWSLPTLPSSALAASNAIDWTLGR